jgi:hypothetical protein
MSRIKTITTTSPVAAAPPKRRRCLGDRLANLRIKTPFCRSSAHSIRANEMVQQAKESRLYPQGYAKIVNYSNPFASRKMVKFISFFTIQRFDLLAKI